MTNSHLAHLRAHIGTCVFVQNRVHSIHATDFGAYYNFLKVYAYGYFLGHNHVFQERLVVLDFCGQMSFVIRIDIFDPCSGHDRLL